METEWSARFQQMGKSNFTDDEIKHERRMFLPLRESANPQMFKDIPRRMDRVNENLRGVFRLLVSGQSDWPLYLYGLAGVGKTRAALALCDFVMHSRYYTVEEASDCIMERPTPSHRGKFIDDLECSGVFVLDEVGCRAKVGDLEYSILKRVLDGRENLRKPLIVISNHGLDELRKRYDARIASRLAAGTVVEITDKDRRTVEK